MRRQLSFVVLLLCALLLSGWGGVLTSALCPHAARAAVAPLAESMGMADDHACCHAQKAEKDEHCPTSSREAMSDMDMKAPAAAEPQSLAAPAGSCSHCIIHKGLPTAPVNPRDARQNNSDANQRASQNAKTVAPPAARLVSTIVPTQGAPPGATARKHLLLSIFLI
jgi:hypothetical protein